MDRFLNFAESFKYSFFIILAILLFAIILDVTQRKVWSFFNKKLKKHDSHWLLPLTNLLPKPLSVFLWLITSAIIANVIINYYTQISVNIYVSKIAQMAIIVVLLWAVLRWKKTFLPLLKKQIETSKIKINTSEMKGFDKTFTICAWIIAIIWGFSVFDIQHSFLFMLFMLTFTFAIDFTQRKFFKFFNKKLETSENLWLQTLMRLISLPISIFLWVTASSIVMQNILAYIEIPVSIPKIIHVAMIITLLWVTLSWKKEFKPILQKKVNSSKIKMGTSEIEALFKAFSVCIWVIAIIWFMSVLNIRVSTLIAFGGAGGLVVGIALKDVIANFFSGFMIYMTKPFQIGDWVHMPSHEVEGTIEENGWYLTQIRSFDKRPIYIPNSLFANSIIINPSRMSHRRIKETIGIRYKDFQFIPKIVTDIENMLRNHPQIDKGQHLLVNFVEFGDFSLNIFVYTFTTDKTWKGSLAIKQDVLLKIGEIIESHNAEIAFPTRTIDLPEQEHPIKINT